MFRVCTAVVRLTAHCSQRAVPALRAGFSCRLRPGITIGFALTLLLVAGGLPVTVACWFPTRVAAAASEDPSLPALTTLDADANGVDDTLDRWLDGGLTWDQLRQSVIQTPGGQLPPVKAESRSEKYLPAGGIWQAGGLRVLHLGPPGGLRDLLAVKSNKGHITLVHDLALASGVQVLAVSREGLQTVLSSSLGGRLLLDRCGTPALDASRPLVGIPEVEKLPWGLGRDWSGSVAILDSGCDTAHGDLGDALDDDRDGPPPVVGDAGDWSSATLGWPLSEDFKVIGWQDVTDDFPAAAGPWDYHYHGTALASVVAGSGAVDSLLQGVAASARLTIVKFYDFDGEWRTWAGDFLAACAWTLENAATYRVRAVLCATNWAQDLGISDAMTAFVEAGIVPVVAMGNQGSDLAGLGFPARLPWVLSVGAVNDQGAVSAFSGRGGNGLLKPDLLAPGGGLLREFGRINAADNDPDDSYSGRVGTSLAAAHVAGAVFLLDEALRATGIALAPSLESVQTLQAILKFTSAPLDMAESSSGSDLLPMGKMTEPDTTRGWGLLRVDAAVHGLRDPLLPHQVGVDTLGGGASPVMARRLVTSGGAEYRVEVLPAAGLDVSLEILDPRWLDDDPSGMLVLRTDNQGLGGAESIVVTGPLDSWLLAAVKVQSGGGTCELKFTEEGSAVGSSFQFTLPGESTADPNVARLGPGTEVSLVIPSRVMVDPVARALNVTDLAGRPRPGWPAFLFPHSSSQGGIMQPLAWDLDGVPGDEIVAASAYGSVYFITGNGVVQEISLTLNLPLTAPVGVVTGGGAHRVVVADQNGVVRAWSAGAVEVGAIDLGHSHPLAPAAGSILPGQAEAVVVACQDGFVAALDADLAMLPGWPQDVGQPLALPPVLLDRDGDGLHEIVVPVWAAAGDPLRLRIFQGDGTLAAEDGLSLDSPTGGDWIAVAPPVVGGGYGGGGLHLGFVGLASNGLSGDQALWQMGRASLAATGLVESEVMGGLQVVASTDQSTLVLAKILLSTPLEYGNPSGLDQEAEVLLHLSWQDLLYGLSSMPGSTTGWFKAGYAPDPMALRQPLDVGGQDAGSYNQLGALLVPEGGVTYRVQVLDDQVGVQALAGNPLTSPYWLSARADGRNSGAAALQNVTSVIEHPAGFTGSLRAFPNPGGEQIFFSLDHRSLDAEAILEVFDLRGRLVSKRLLPPRGQMWQWDGRNDHGRRLPAGLYLVAVKMGSQRFTTRVTLAR